MFKSIFSNLAGSGSVGLLRCNLTTTSRTFVDILPSRAPRLKNSSSRQWNRQVDLPKSLSKFEWSRKKSISIWKKEGLEPKLSREVSRSSRESSRPWWNKDGQRHDIFQWHRQFHTTPRQHISPVLLLIIKPLAKFGSVITGR